MISPVAVAPSNPEKPFYQPREMMAGGEKQRDDNGGEEEWGEEEYRKTKAKQRNENEAPTVALVSVPTAAGRGGGAEDNPAKAKVL